MERKETTTPIDDPLVFGKDPTPRIVALHVPRSSPEQQAKVVINRRSQGATISSEADFYPFFFVSDPQPFSRDSNLSLTVRKLQGTGTLKWLVIADCLQAYWAAVREAREIERVEPDFRYHLITSLESQYMVQSGCTLFKGMSFSDLRRMQVDIEVPTDAAFPNAARAEDSVAIISMSDDSGWSLVLSTINQSEKELLQAFLETLTQRDPDVIEGHNIYGFDIPYLRKRCERYGIPFAIGRHGQVPRFYQSNIRFAERLVTYEACEVPGRHIVDTYFLSMAYDVTKRNLSGYGLKSVARSLGVASEDREYVDGDRIAETWRVDPERLVRYALHDVEETGRIAALLSGSTFFLSQMLPMNYGHAARSGPGIKIELLMIREYLRRRTALPVGDDQVQTLGGYTDIFVQGVVGPIVYADIESLYPSIMLSYEIRPTSDELEVFTSLLRRLTSLRLAAKAEALSAKGSLRIELDARQSSYKILINSFYGLLGFRAALFCDAAKADEVARRGQQVLRTMIAGIESRGGTVIEVDTDGVFFIPPESVVGEPLERAFLSSVGEDLKSDIRVGFDGRYQRMLSYKMKNYALLDYSGRTVIKGSALISRSLEPFGRTLVRNIIESLLTGDTSAVRSHYMKVRDDIVSRNWSVDKFARSETVKLSVEEYESAVLKRRRPRSALYELLRREQASGKRVVRRGDKVRFYVVSSGDSDGMIVKLAEDWVATAPDEDTAYYLRRLYEFVDKFRDLFTPESFAAVFPTETHGQASLFAFPKELQLAPLVSRKSSFPDSIDASQDDKKRARD